MLYKTMGHSNYEAILICVWETSTLESCYSIEVKLSDV